MDVTATAEAAATAAFLWFLLGFRCRFISAYEPQPIIIQFFNFIAAVAVSSSPSLHHTQTQTHTHTHSGCIHGMFVCLSMQVSECVNRVLFQVAWIHKKCIIIIVTLAVQPKQQINARQFHACNTLCARLWIVCFLPNVLRWNCATNNGARVNLFLSVAMCNSVCHAKRNNGKNHRWN